MSITVEKIPIAGSTRVTCPVIPAPKVITKEIIENKLIKKSNPKKRNDRFTSKYQRR